MGFLDCRASSRFLTRYERELREPLVWRQGSQVPTQVCASARWEPATATQSAPEAVMLTAASRGGPPRAAAQGPGSQVLPVTVD